MSLLWNNRIRSISMKIDKVEKNIENKQENNWNSKKKKNMKEEKKKKKKTPLE